MRNRTGRVQVRGGRSSSSPRPRDGWSARPNAGKASGNIDRQKWVGDAVAGILAGQVASYAEGPRGAHVALAHRPLLAPPLHWARASELLRAARGVHPRMELLACARARGAGGVVALGEIGGGRAAPTHSSWAECGFVPSWARDASAERAAGGPRVFVRRARSRRFMALRLVLPPSYLCDFVGWFQFFFLRGSGREGASVAWRGDDGWLCWGSRARAIESAGGTRTLPRTSPASGPCATRTRPGASRDPPSCSRGSA